MIKGGVFERGVVSYPKCGRTWIRLFFEYYGRFTGDHPMDVIVYAHDDRYEIKRRILLVRHPCDVMVSLYFHKKMRVKMKASLSQLIRSKHILPTFNKLYENWSERIEGQQVVQYENLFDISSWFELVEFLNIPIDDEAIDKSFEKTKFKNVRKNMEEINTFDSAWRFLPAEHGKYRVLNPKSPDAHKFRRGVIGGYSDYMDEDDIKFIMDNFTLGKNLEPIAQEYRRYDERRIALHSQ